MSLATSRAVQVRDVSRQLWRDSSIDFMAYCPLPPDPWFVRGPRGGLYIATGARSRVVDETGGDRWDKNIVAIVDESEGVKYVRPGSRLHRQALAEATA